MKVKTSFRSLAAVLTLAVTLLLTPHRAEAAAWHCTVTIWYNTNLGAYRYSTAVAGDVVTACAKASGGALSLQNSGLYFYGLGCGSVTRSGSVGDNNYQYCFSLPTYIQYY